MAKEVFREYFWTPVTRNENSTFFWRWLANECEVSSLPRGLRSMIQLFLDWYSEWRGSMVDSEFLRARLLLALLMDYVEVAVQYDLRDRLSEAEQIGDLPWWVRTLPGQLRALGVMS
jgi:hypothetical protein